MVLEAADVLDVQVGAHRLAAAVGERHLLLKVEGLLDAVQEDLVVLDPDLVALDGHDALDEVDLFGHRVAEHDDVTALGSTEVQQLEARDDADVVQEGDLDDGGGNPDAVAELGHRDVVTDLQGRNHRTTGDPKGLDHERADEEHGEERGAPAADQVHQLGHEAFRPFLLVVHRLSGPPRPIAATRYRPPHRGIARR